VVGWDRGLGTSAFPLKFVREHSLERRGTMEKDCPERGWGPASQYWTLFKKKDSYSYKA